MADENKTQPEPLENGENENARVKFPVKTANALIPFVGRAYQKYGANEILSNEKIADANDLSANSIKQSLSTCQQYNFLKNIHGKGYKITQDFTRIFHPENDDEKNQAVIACLTSVPFYLPLFNSYNESVVPQAEGLVNRFIRDHGMIKKSAITAADIFIQNLKDYGLLNSRNVLIVKGKPNQAPTVTINDNKEASPSTVATNDKKADSALLNYEFPLTGDKKAVLQYPKESMDPEDFDIMAMAIELLAKSKKLTLQMEIRKKGAENAPN